MQMGNRLLMHGEDIGAGLGEIGDIAVGIFNHQVHVEGQVRHLARRFDDQRTDGDVRHEMAVHDIHMHIIGAGRLDGTDFFPEAGKIRRQNGGSDFDHY